MPISAAEAATREARSAGLFYGHVRVIDPWREKEKGFSLHL